MFRTIVSIIFIVASAVGIAVYAAPGYQETKLLRENIAELEEALQKAAELRAAREQLLARYNAFTQADLANLETMLPSHVDNVKLVSIDIEQLASEHGLILKDVSVEEAQDAVADPAQVSNPLGTILIDFSTLGSYDAFIDFLDALEKSLRIIDIQSVDFSQQPRRDREGNVEVPDYYEFQVTMATYWLRRGVAITE
ncbi:type 4a pilus biogenesis protein PilO [Candidatus Nomurabacteria bacterium]|nr:type 4a pilus biogenesis protein PilO [Candidatus Nomurabacteria bacterium]